MNGSWEDDIAQTVDALRRFIDDGHTTRTGNYRAQVRKAAQWLRAAAPMATDSERALMSVVLTKLADATGEDWSLIP
ncbi:MAG: hypothetical protein IPK19_37300 [Chloroflexi bacterium]|nr:hypothetical protein [Chloroflexota bacterium]